MDGDTTKELRAAYLGHGRDTIRITIYASITIVIAIRLKLKFGMNALTNYDIFIKQLKKNLFLLITLIWHKIKSTKQMLSLFNDY